MWFLLGVVIAAYLINIKLAVALNDWNGRFYNALQVVNKEEIFSCLYDFILLCSAIILVLVTADYLQGRAALIARRELTQRFFNRGFRKMPLFIVCVWKIKSLTTRISELPKIFAMRSQFF